MRNRGTRYRYIGDEPLENAGSAGAASAQAGTTAAAKTRSRPNSEYVLYSNGEPVAVNSDNGVSYFGTDILGSVRSVTDKYGAVVANYEYDAFGAPYLSNLDSGMSFGYTGKIFDSATGLYDYGFRDYAPNSARFTTVDPVRDGNNWFSYCMNDAVNYVDLFGLEPSNSTNQRQKVIIDSVNNIYNFYNPNKGKKDSLTTQEQYEMAIQDSLNKSNEKVTDVYIVRNNDNIGNNFDATRYIFKDGTLVYQDEIGANAYKENWSNVNADSTTPDGLYYLSNTGTKGAPLYRNSDGTTDSNSYRNVLSLRTNDMTLSEKERNAVNYGDRYFHANQKNGKEIYSKDNPFGLGCMIGQNGQQHQNDMISILMDGVSDPRKIEVQIISLSNIEVFKSNDITFNNIIFDNTGNAALASVTDFSARVTNFAKNAFNINPFNNFSGGCTK